MCICIPSIINTLLTNPSGLGNTVKKYKQNRYLYMATLNLDTGELNNKSIILEGNSQLNDTHKEILIRFEVIYI